MIISLREFQQKATKYLNDLPLTLTQYNKPIAKVVPYEEKIETLAQPEYHTSPSGYVTKKENNVQESETTCVHGAQKGLCRYGCK